MVPKTGALERGCLRDFATDVHGSNMVGIVEPIVRLWAIDLQT
jgi:hypothetical protein